MSFPSRFLPNALPVALHMTRTTSGLVYSGPALYYGYLVTTVLGAGAINLRDAIITASGDIIDIILSLAAVGNDKRLGHGIYCETGIWADFASTGGVTFFFRPEK